MTKRREISSREKHGMAKRFHINRTKNEEERFLSAQADPFAGAKAEEKVGLLRSK